MAPVVAFLVLTGSVVLGAWKGRALSRWPGCPNRLEDGIFVDCCCVLLLWSALRASGSYFVVLILTLWSALKVELRTKWVARLDENTMTLEWTEEEKDELLAWAKKFKMTTQELEEALSNKMWRKGLIRSRNVV